MSLFEFLNRISFFSILAWAFYFIAALCAIVLTTLSTPLARKYRKNLIAVGTSGIMLGTIAWCTPYFLRKLNPDQSKLTSIDQLTSTEWIEPVSNPETELPKDEINWAKQISVQFKYKIQLKEEFSRAIAIEGDTVVYLDKNGTLHGFNAYSGLNRWQIELHTYHYLGSLLSQKKLYLLDRTSLDALRISCFDLQSPSLLWQRTIPNSREDASLTVDWNNQSVIVSAASNGIWALKQKTGEILWKRPELYVKTKTLPSDKHILAFEPMVAGRAGSWYFLDPATGKTLQKNPHAFTDIQSLIPGEMNPSLPPFVIAKVDDHNYFNLNHLDLSQGWSQHSNDQKIKIIENVGRDRYLVLYESNLLELHNSQTNALLWQKQLTQINPVWMAVSPNLDWIILPNQSEDEVPGLSFFRTETSEYVVTVRTTEPILDLRFFGDWLYLFSENHLWALKRN